MAATPELQHLRLHGAARYSAPVPPPVESSLNSKELKAKLAGDGFLVFRTLGSEVRLAERIRENLILDSGVAALITEAGVVVRVAYRSEATTDPQATEPQHFERASARATDALRRGYVEVERRTTPRVDPGDAERVLDTWYEAIFHSRALSWQDVTPELRWALEQPRRL